MLAMLVEVLFDAGPALWGRSVGFAYAAGDWL